MINESLNRVLGNIDLGTDKAAWVRFRDWIESFHEISTTRLTQFNTFSEFNENGEVELPLKYFDAIKDLWVKWSKAVESDMAADV